MKHAQLNLTCPFRYDDLKELYKTIKPDMKVLDVGCSYGFETTRLASTFPETDFLGIDIDEKAIEIARKGVWHTSLFLSPDNFLKKELWHPIEFPDTFKYGDGKNVKTIKSENGYIEAYINKKTGKHITQKDYEEPWSVVKRNRFLDNLEFRIKDLDHMNFDKASFDIIIATSCVFRPTTPKYCKTQEKLEHNNNLNEYYKNHFKQFLKKKGALFTGNEVIWN